MLTEHISSYVNPRIFEYVEQCETYESAVATLKALYIKPTNEVFARHLLATRRQRNGESLDEFLQALKTLSKDCNFKDVTAAIYRDEAIRDSFITGLLSNSIRQRFFEKKTLDLSSMFSQARALDSAQNSSESYMSGGIPLPTAATVAHTPSIALPSAIDTENTPEEGTSYAAAVVVARSKCFFCGNGKHARQRCPARDEGCRRCSKKGHFAKVCRSNPATPGRDGITSATFPTLAAVSSRTPPVLLKSKDGITAATFPTLAAVSSRTPPVLLKSSTMVTINGEEVRALVDSGSTESFIHPDLVKKLNTKSQASPTAISMAQSSLSAQTLGYCIVDLVLN